MRTAICLRACALCMCVCIVVHVHVHVHCAPSVCVCAHQRGCACVQVDDLPEAVPAGQPANSVLLQLLRAGQQPGRGGLRLLSWNCKMMNTTDLRDWEWVGNKRVIS